MKKTGMFIGVCVGVFFLAGRVMGQADDRLPLLVLATDKAFGSYTAEILHAEGFNLFKMDSVQRSNFNAPFLKKFSSVILAQSELSKDQQNIIRNYVKGGGNLIAFRPDTEMADLFGIVDAGADLNGGYIKMDTASEAGAGLSGKPLQLHVVADNYTMGAGKMIASLFSASNMASGSPAVVMNTFSKGRAVAFLYNLPENIVLTRQGDPAKAGMETDSIPGIRAMDLFTNGWVNTALNTVNQADEQMRLLSHCLEVFSTYSKPLPRLWYFPDTLTCLVTLNNDGEDSEEPEFTPQFEDVNAKNAKMTLYIKEPEKVSKEWVERWTGKGFEIAAHPDDTKQAVLPDWNTMDSVIVDIKKRLKEKYGINELHTNTNHWFVWVGNRADGTPDFSAQAAIEEKNNIGLDCNYAHYDNNSREGHFLGDMGINQGNYTGSGLTMKFARNDGRIINVYQQLNNVYDQQYMEHKDPDGYFNAFRGLMDRSMNEEVYSVISVKAHNNEYYFSKVPLMQMMDYAGEKNIPVWTEQKFLEFLRARDEATFTKIKWNKNKLTFNLESALKHSSQFTFMIPATARGRTISKIAVNDTPAAIISRFIKGREYLLVTVPFGSIYRVEATY